MLIIFLYLWDFFFFSLFSQYITNVSWQKTPFLWPLLVQRAFFLGLTPKPMPGRILESDHVVIGEKAHDSS